MKKTLFFATLVALVTGRVVHAQVITPPFSTIGHGGGRAAGGTITLVASMGQPAPHTIGHAAAGVTLEGGYIPGLRVLSGTLMSCGMPMRQGWNMISLGVTRDTCNKSVLFPTAISKAFAYEGGYVVKDTLHMGKGYWIKLASEETAVHSGTACLYDTFQVRQNWNMIGGVSYPSLKADIVAVPPLVFESGLYTYGANGYEIVDALQPGRGYWLKVRSDGKLVVKAASFLAGSGNPASPMKSQLGVRSAGGGNDGRDEAFNRLTFTDALGKHATLYFSARPRDLNLTQYELPPVPPDEIFDVRFGSNRTTEVATAMKPSTFPIRLQGVVYPITVKWEMLSSEDGTSLDVVYEGREPAHYEAKGKEEIELREPGIQGMYLSVTGTAGLPLPMEYSLLQNYPNPFNPTTTIRYQLPVDSKVSLRVYDQLGRVVGVLVDGTRAAGYESADWNGSGVASGVYYYRLEASGLSDQGKKFTHVMKMMLVR